MTLIKETNLKFGNLSKHSQNINRIVIHHIGPPNRDVSAEEVHKWHLNQGWSGIGYHFVIRRDGTIERGRPEWAIGSHAYGYNDSTIGINFAGNMQEMTLTDAQIESGAMLLADICIRYKINPSANTIVGHSDLMATSCPGKNLYPILGTLRGKAIWYQQNPCW